MGRLSKSFQKTELDFSSIGPVVNSTCASLKDLIECEGVFVDKISLFVQQKDESVVYARPVNESDCKSVSAGIERNVEFEGFSDDECNESMSNEQNESQCDLSTEIHYYEQQKNVIEKVLPQYVNKIVQNLEDRFQDGDIVDKMQVLVPSSISSTESAISKYGVEEFKGLVDHFSCHIEGGLETCLSEYQHYKRLVLGNFKNHSLKEVMLTVGNKYLDMLPNVYALLKCCAVIPMTSVQCERGFSTQNRLKSKFRSSMKSQHLMI